MARKLRVQYPGAMAVELSGNDVLIRWPASAAGLRLEQSDDLADPQAWFWPEQVPVLTGDVNTVRIPAVATVGYFRLGSQ